MTYDIPNSDGYDFRQNISDALNAIDSKAETDPSAVHLTGDETVAGVKTFSSTITSSVVTGTAPLTIVSTTKVVNLNADSVGGYKIWKGTQAEYDALSPNYDDNTIYFING